MFTSAFISVKRHLYRDIPGTSLIYLAILCKRLCLTFQKQHRGFRLFDRFPACVMFKVEIPVIEIIKTQRVVTWISLSQQFPIYDMKHPLCTKTWTRCMDSVDGRISANSALTLIKTNFSLKKTITMRGGLNINWHILYNLFKSHSLSLFSFPAPPAMRIILYK